MIFASQIFLFWFLPLVLGIYYAVPTRARSLVLVLASYLFYGWWRLDFTLLMVISTVIDYFCGRGLSRPTPPCPDSRPMKSRPPASTAGANGCCSARSLPISACWPTSST